MECTFVTWIVEVARGADTSAMGTVNRNTVQLRRGGPDMTYYSVWKKIDMSVSRSLLMPYRVRQIAPESKMCQHVSLDMLQGIRRSEEHTSELQSHLNLVCRLLLE